MSGTPTFFHRRSIGVKRPPIYLLLLFAALAVTVYAQTPSDSVNAENPIAQTQTPLGVNQTTGQLPTFAQLFTYSTYSTVINSIILALSGVAVLLFVFFMLTTHTRGMAPPDFVDEITKLTLRGKYEQAADLCRTHRNVFIATIVVRCLDNAGKPTSVIMNIIDTEGRRRADLLWNRISYLADISNVGPMLGLLGTVLGMIEAFFVLPTQSGNIKSATLASGVGAAMSTTMFGLMLAILALVFYSLVKGRATRALAETEQAVHMIADHIKRPDPARVRRDKPASVDDANA